jgi:hypothetical protein
MEAHCTSHPTPPLPGFRYPTQPHLDTFNTGFILFQFSSSDSAVEAKVTLSPCLVKYHANKTFEGVKIQLHTILTSAVDEDKWSASRFGLFCPVPAGYESGWVPKSVCTQQRREKSLPGIEPRSSIPWPSTVISESHRQPYINCEIVYSNTSYVLTFQ